MSNDVVRRESTGAASRPVAVPRTFQKMGSGTPAERCGGGRERRVGGRRDAAAVPPKRRAITSGVDEAMVARPRDSRDRMRSSCL